MRRPPFLRFSFKRKGGCKVVRPAATLLFCPAVCGGEGRYGGERADRASGGAASSQVAAGIGLPVGKNEQNRAFCSLPGLRLAIPEQNATICSDLATQAMAKEQRRGDGGEEETEETADGSRRAKEGGGRGTGGIAAGSRSLRRQQRGRCGGLWGRPSSRPAVAQTLLNDGRIASRPVNYLPCLAARSSRAIQAKMRAGERRDLSFAHVFGNSARIQGPQPLIRARFR